MTNRYVCDKMHLQEVTNTIVLNQRSTAELTNRLVLNLRRTAEVTKKVVLNQRSTAELTKRLVLNLRRTAELTNTIVLNFRRTAEVSRKLRETRCCFQRVLFCHRDREFVFILLDVYGFPLFRTELFKPFAFKPDFGDRYHAVAAFLVGGVDFKFSGIHHGHVFLVFIRL